MATKEDATTKAPAKATPAKMAEPTAAKDIKATPAAVDEDPIVSTCVVNGGRGTHVGNAVNGKVCSYHAMHYDRDGSPR